MKIRDALERGQTHIVCNDGLNFDVRILKSGQFLITNQIKNGKPVVRYDTKMKPADAEKHAMQHGGVDEAETMDAGHIAEMEAMEMEAMEIQPEEEPAEFVPKQPAKRKPQKGFEDNIPTVPAEPEFDENIIEPVLEDELEEAADNINFEPEESEAVPEPEDMENLYGPEAQEIEEVQEMEEDFPNEQAIQEEPEPVIEEPYSKPNEPEIPTPVMQEPAYGASARNVVEINYIKDEKEKEMKHYDYGKLLSHLAELSRGGIYKCQKCGKELEIHNDGTLQCPHCGAGHLNTQGLANYTVQDFLSAQIETQKFNIDEEFKFESGKAFFLKNDAVQLYINTESKNLVLDAPGITYEQPVSAGINAEVNKWLSGRYLQVSKKG